METTSLKNAFSGISSGTTNYDMWSSPERVEVNEVGNSIEMIYKQTSMISCTSFPPQPPQERVFKIIYSCIKGKWNKSERIYGDIIPMQDECYEF